MLVRDFSLYDFVLLYYPFNRRLDALKALAPMKEKLILMPNTLCHVDCPSMQYWFPDPKHPSLFDDWVGGYKLQGREYTTDLIMYICSIYFNREPADELLNALLGGKKRIHAERLLSDGSSAGAE